MTRQGHKETITYKIQDYIKTLEIPDAGGDPQKVHVHLNWGLPASEKITMDVGTTKCPCRVCKHTDMAECEALDCKCCTAICN